MLARGDIVLVAFISSNTAGPPADDELDIPAEHPEFAESGLKVSSRLRITRMTTLSAQLSAAQPTEAMARPDPIRVWAQILTRFTMASDPGATVAPVP